jgi:hypothetical protein
MKINERRKLRNWKEVEGGNLPEIKFTPQKSMSGRKVSFTYRI